MISYLRVRFQATLEKHSASNVRLDKLTASSGVKHQPLKYVRWMNVKLTELYAMFMYGFSLSSLLCCVVFHTIFFFFVCCAVRECWNVTRHPIIDLTVDEESCK